jgi:nucleoside-diphosphate-sugar epimerase
MENNSIVTGNDLLLVTGANGFIGAKVVAILLEYGFSRVRCLVRPTSNLSTINKITERHKGRVELLSGNLLSRDFCRQATEGVSVIFHLAAGMEKSFAGSFLNSVVTTRNLLDAALENGKLKRFLNVSSFAVYSTPGMRRGQLLDETCPVESEHVERHDPYCFAKVKQDEIVVNYGRERKLPYVIVRPGAVYGPHVRQRITGRVGIDTFGLFLHLGGSNEIPLTYVDNCAEAIVLAGISKGVEGEVFNIVDDDLPTSRAFLRLYKRNVRAFKSIYLPYRISYFLCCLWEKYSRWSRGQLPPAFNRRRCSAYWKGNRYSNKKLKELTGWKPRVPFAEAAQRYFEYLRTTGEGLR